MPLSYLEPTRMAFKDWIMTSAFPALAERRVSTNHFDRDFVLSDAEIADLLAVAVRAPSAYNLQNWRFVAVRSPEAKRRLRDAAFRQVKVEEASVVVVICGQKPDADTLPERLAPAVAAGILSASAVETWRAGAASHYAEPQAARDEAIRSATLASAFLMLAAEAKGFASCPMVGFDPSAVQEAFDLGTDEVPVLLLAIGRAAAGNRAQKARRPIDEVVSFQ